MLVPPAAFWVFFPFPIKIIKSEVMIAVGGRRSVRQPSLGEVLVPSFLPQMPPLSRHPVLFLFFVLFMNK